MDANDKLFEELVDKQISALRLDANLRKKILKDLEALETKIVAKIRDIDIESARNKTKKLKILVDEINKVIKEDYSAINAKMKADLTSLAKIEAKGFNNLVASFGVVTSLASVSKVTLNNIYKDRLIEGAPSETWWKRQSVLLQNRFVDQMKQGLILGETNQDLVRRVRGSKALNYTDGIMQATRNDAEALIRSSVQAVANQARFEVLESNDDIIESYQHVSTLDSRTTTICAVRDGKRWDAKTKEPIGHDLPFKVPPVHWGCRSTLIANLKGIELPNDATRASIDGPVKASLTFEDYLYKKIKSDPGFIDELLGPGRAELFRSGDITLRQLLDQSGNPLSLAQLKQRYGV